MSRTRRHRGRRLRGALAAAAVVVLLPTLALAHVERASYWPNPKPDRSVSPAAGGKIPKYRPLFTALRTGPPGETLVVCKGSPSRGGKARSIRRLRRNIRRARGLYPDTWLTKRPMPRCGGAG